MLNITLLDSEIFKPIKGFEDYYEISNKGRIHNKRKLIKTFINNSGYECIKLTVNKVRYNFTIHRLVALNFLSDKKSEVNHLDGNKLNNSLDNLEWTTSSENKKHARKIGISIYNLPTKGLKKGKTSKYHNVCYDKSKNMWKACIRHNKKDYGFKRFKTEIQAAKHVNTIIDKYKLDRPKNKV